MTAQDFADLMIRRGYKVRQIGNTWRAQCPAHGGDDLNMTIRPHPEGGVIATCHSHKCPRPDIATAMGVEMSDLTAPKANGNGHPRGPQTVYPYADENGNVLYEVRRDANKDFRMWLPDAERPGVGDVRRVLFGLPALLLTQSGDVVCIAEGEKCSMAVALLGIPCTTNPNGAGKWRPEYTAWIAERLPGRRFLVLADNDAEGKKHALAVCDALQMAKLEVYLADLGELPEKGDVVQWIAAGGTAEQLREMAAPKTQTKRQREREEEQRIISAPELMAKHFEPLQWAVPEIIPEGLTVLAGGTKTGKSWLSLHIAIAIASGGAVFGQIPVEPGEAIYLALEDSQRRLQDRLRTLLQGSPAPAGLYLVTHWELLGDGFVERLDEWLTEHPACRLVIVDVFQKIRSARKQAEIQYDADYVATSALQELPREHRVSMVVLHHTRKMTAPDPFDMVSGSVGITGGADSVLVLMRQRDQKDATLHSIGREGPFDAMALEWDDRLCVWNLVGKAEDHRLSAERKTILGFMRKAKTDLQPAEIAGALSMNPSAVRYLLGQMVEDGQIIKSHYGKYTMTEVQKMNTATHTPHTPSSPHTPHTPHSDEGSYEPGSDG